VQLRERPHQRQADPEAALRAVERALALDEKPEDLRQHVAGDADALVLDAEHGIVALGRRANADGPAGRRVLHRVADEVQDDLLHGARGRHRRDVLELGLDDVAAPDGAALSTARACSTTSGSFRDGDPGRSCRRAPAPRPEGRRSAV